MTGVMGCALRPSWQPIPKAAATGGSIRKSPARLTGDTASAERVDDQDKLVLSVAAPVESRYRTIYGVLLLSTESGDIDDILRQERATLIEVALVAFAVMLLSSLYLASTIAEPVRRLAAAADQVRQGLGGRDAIPGFPERNDEIGDLADSFKEMTAGAL